MDWYDIIEKPIRPLVKLLRDNGFNTVCSCGHDMTIQADLTPDGELFRLHKLLFNYLSEKGRLVSYTITVHLEVVKGGFPRCFLEVKFSKMRNLI